MKTALAFIMIFFGFPYLINVNTKEIHDLRRKTKQCLIPAMKRKNMAFASTKAVYYYLTNGYNGCKYCLPKLNTG